MNTPNLLSSPITQRRALLRMVRPSLLDQRFRGDLWLVASGEESFTLCLGNYQLAGIRGVDFDLPSLNQTLDRLRNRCPRRKAV